LAHVAWQFAFPCQIVVEFEARALFFFAVPLLYKRATSGCDPERFLHFCGLVAGFYQQVQAKQNNTSFLETVSRISAILPLSVAHRDANKTATWLWVRCC